MTKPFLLLFSFIILLTSCQKDALRNDGSILLRKIIHTTYNNDIYTFNFSYDNQNRLIYFKAGSNFYTWRAVTAIEYDSAGRLSKALYYDINDSDVIIKHNFSHSFLYDNNNRIIKRIYTPLSLTTAGGDDRSYGYDLLGRLISDTLISGQNGTAYRYTKFNYDENNNVVERTEYDLSSFGSPYLYSYVSSYDNKRNPYSILNLGTDFYFVSQNIYVMSANNQTREFRWGDEPHIKRHEYDSGELVKKSVFYPESHPQFHSTFEYFYQ